MPTGIPKNGINGSWFKIGHTINVGRIHVTKRRTISLEDREKRKNIAIEKGFGQWMKGRKMPEIIKEKIRRKILGTKRPKEFGEAISIRESGSKSHRWKGGITPLNHKIRNCLKYKKWRISYFTRDDYTCQICKVRGGNLEVHHTPKMFYKIMEENNIKTYEQALDCEQLWDLDNGLTLCKKCHRIKTSFGGNKI